MGDDGKAARRKAAARAAEAGGESAAVGAAVSDASDARSLVDMKPLVAVVLVRNKLWIVYAVEAILGKVGQVRWVLFGTTTDSAYDPAQQPRRPRRWGHAPGGPGE